MRVLVFSHMFPNPSDPIRGIFVLEQVKALRNLGVETFVIAPVPWVPPMLKFLPRFRKYRLIPERASIQGVAVEYPRVLSFSSRRVKFLYSLSYYVGCYRLVRKLLAQHSTDLIHVHAALPDGVTGVLFGRAFKVPVVCTVHGSDINYYPGFNRLTLFATKWALRRIDRLVAVSHALKEQAFSMAGFRQADVVHNGAEPGLFKPIKKAEARAKLNLPVDKKIVLCVSSLLARKGIENLLEAVHQITRQDVLLCLLGEGRHKPVLMSLANRLGITEVCRFVGRRPHDEMPWWFSAADCLVISSLSEGFPTVLAEAMLCRLPIVSTEVGGIPEAIRDGSTGLLVKPKDPAGLAVALNALLRDEERVSYMVDRAETTAQAELTWDANARKMLAVYHDELSRRHNGRASQVLPLEGVDRFGPNATSQYSEKQAVSKFAASSTNE